MRKALIIIVTMITFIIIYLLQSNFFIWFNIAGVKPNLFVMLVLVLGLFGGKHLGSIFGIIIGLLLDIFIGRKIGISAIILGFIGLMGGFLDKNFSKDSKLTIIVMVTLATLIYEVSIYCINIFMFSYDVELVSFITKLSIEIIYNALLTIILYPTIQKSGFYIENTYRDNRILTRYF